MAGCQARTFARLRVAVLLFALFIACNAYKPVFEDIPTHVFQEHIVYSRHQPFCVIFRDTGVGSKLENTVYNIWRNEHSSQANYTKWKVEAFHASENKLPANTVGPRTTPAVRCYLGETSNYDYLGSVSTGAVRRWLTQLDSRYSEQNIAVTRSLLDDAKESHDIVLLAFPDNPRHYEVEDMVYRLATEVVSCKSFTVHLNTEGSKQLEQEYGVKDHPSVVVIHSRGGPDTEGDYRVFEGLKVNHGVLFTYITASSLMAPMLTTETFEKLLFHQDTESFRPILVCVYNHWNTSAASYIEEFGVTVNTFTDMGSKLLYGTVNLADRSSRKLVRQYLQTGSMTVIPFLVLFTKDVNDTVSQVVLNQGRPLPWIVYPQLVSAGVADLYGIQETLEPWGAISLHEITPLYEGPYGYACSTWSHNMTENTPVMPKVFTTKRKKLKKKKEGKKIWHETFATETVEKLLELHVGIPLITQSTWADVIEKSHAPKHVFYQSGQWAGEVTKVALVVFLMADCGSCERNEGTFQDIQKSVAMIDGGAMYLVYCTSEKELCRHHNIRGFPTIVVFRGLGWMGTSTCMSGTSQGMFTNYVRMDYHGVIQANAIMAWFSAVAANAVTDRKFEQVVETFKDKNARLVATLMPRKTRYLPLPPRRNTAYYFKYECLRLICERLFSVIDCYSRYSPEIPHAEFAVKGLDLIVTTIILERKDGVSATVMNFGDYLRETLENPSDTSLHQFHRPHRYNIGKTQKCEHDHAACVDIITDFTLDHSRQPVTPLTTDMFHTASSHLKEEELPILIALVYPENITISSQFLKNLTSIAYEKYNELIVMTIDAYKYTAWAGMFVPYRYGRLRVVDPAVTDPYSMYRYPRLCIVKKTDHKHAAFHPPVTQPRNSDDVDFSFDRMLEFVDQYLKDPDSVSINTEQF